MTIYTLTRLPGTVGSYATDAQGGRWHTWHHVNVPPLACDACGAHITRGWARLGTVHIPWLHVCSEHVQVQEFSFTGGQ